MHDLLRRTAGEQLDVDALTARFDKDYWQLGEPGFWKLERRQMFQEPMNDSWRAFASGRWDEAVRLAEATRSRFEEEYRKDAQAGIESRWVKVVEKPITPYTQWAFLLFRIRAESGEHARVVRSEQVEPFEKHGLLPEMTTLGSDVMYELVYDDTGLQEGGIRITDRDVVARCQRIIADLYSVGEDVESFYQREMADLEPPSGS